MSGGVFAVSRGLLEHEIFAEEPFTEREAFIWLLGEAAWKERRVRVGRALINLQRGQCAYTMRFMAVKWKWSDARVRRFLNKLKNDAMIDVLSDALATRITISNYDKYQKVSKPSDALDDAPGDGLATDSRRKEKSRGIQDKPILPRSAYSSEFERFRTAYPKRDGGQDWSKASESFEAHRRAGVDPEDIIKGAELYAADCRRRSKIGTEFVKQAAAFVRGRHWPEWLEQAPPKINPNWPLPADEPSARAAWLRGSWPNSFGPAPGLPGCKVPESVQREWLAEKALNMAERSARVA